MMTLGYAFENGRSSSRITLGERTASTGKNIDEANWIDASVGLFIGHTAINPDVDKNIFYENCVCNDFDNIRGKPDLPSLTPYSDAKCGR